MQTKMRLGEFLVSKSIITRDDLSRARFRRTAGAVALLRAWQETRALLVSLLPLAALLTWASQRMPYLPPAPQDPLEFVAWLPSSAVGSVVHLVPVPGWRSQDGWIREVTPSQRGGRARGTASWVLQAPSGGGADRLTIRFRDRSLEHPVGPGQNRYEPPQRTHGDDYETQLRLREYRPFGVVAVRWLPPWLLVYAILVLVGYPLLKRALLVA